jgi:hypothetical protein
MLWGDMFRPAKAAYQSCSGTQSIAILNLRDLQHSWRDLLESQYHGQRRVFSQPSATGAVCVLMLCMVVSISRCAPRWRRGATRDLGWAHITVEQHAKIKS